MVRRTKTEVRREAIGDRAPALALSLCAIRTPYLGTGYTLTSTSLRDVSFSRRTPQYRQSSLILPKPTSVPDTADAATLAAPNATSSRFGEME